MQSEEPTPLVVLPRPEHCLSRKNIDPDALKVMHRLHRNGYKAYLVGGSVRDLLLGKTPKDFDVSTDARPGQIKKLFRNSRIIGRRFRLAHVFFRGNKIIEVSTFRRRPPDPPPEGEEGARKGDNTFGQPHEDAQRRDLTINGLFYDIATFSIIDYVGGIADLRQGVVRSIGDPDERFREDPVRMIRTVRHAVRAGFEIGPETRAAVLRNADLLTESNPSRLQDELQKDLSSGCFAAMLRLQQDLGLLADYFPDLDRYLRSPISREHPLFNPAWVQEALSTLDRAPPPPKDDVDPRLLCMFAPLLEEEALSRHESLMDSLQDTVLLQDRLREYAALFGVPRRSRDRMRTLWTGWIRLLAHLERERIPAHFRKKPYYPDVVRWHIFHGSISGVPETETNEAIQRAARPAVPSTRKRRRRRKKRLKEPAKPVDFT